MRTLRIAAGSAGEHTGGRVERDATAQVPGPRERPFGPARHRYLEEECLALVRATGVRVGEYE